MPNSRNKPIMSVAFIIRSLERGGTERSLLTLARELNAEDFDITVLTLYSGAFVEELRTNHIKVVELKKSGRWDIRAFKRLFAAVRQIKPDVLYGFSAAPNIISVLLKPFLSPTKIFWGVRRSCLDFVYCDWFSRLVFRCLKLLSPFADLIIFNSYAGCSYYLSNRFPPHKCAVVWNGIDIEHFTFDPNAGARVRAELGVPATVPLIGLVARLTLIKDHANFLRAAAAVSARRPDVRFICIGTGPANYARQLCRLAAELGLTDKVIWAGERADMPAVFSALTVACCSSASEGFSNAIGEAMACGIPCVSTDVGDAAEIIGNTGIIVPPHDPVALTAGLIACLERRGGRAASDARAWIVQNFSAARQAEQIAGAIRHALAPDGARGTSV